jgi:7-cyano-7-deazaguanine synthase
VTTSAPRPAIVLLSGGLDSATCLAIARDRGFSVHALSFDYGQRHRHELEAAARIARALGVASHRTVTIDLRAIGGSALTADIAVPKSRSMDDLSHGIPITYVPARNLVFLSLAAGLAEVVGASDLFIGINAIDYSGYPDCRPEFVESFEKTVNLATRAGAEGHPMRVHAPLARMSKAEIIRLGASLGVDYGLTTSCYDPDEHGRACGECDSCILRRQGFSDAGVADPTLYVARSARARVGDR